MICFFLPDPKRHGETNGIMSYSVKINSGREREENGL
jgi:hypothetical protein